MAAADRCVRSWACGGIIGAGAFGSVNLAVDNDTGELFAIKSTECRGRSSSGTSSGGGGSGSAALVALENELSILQSLQSSPRIVKCLGSAWSTSAQSGQPVRSVFLEYMPGGSVTDLMAKLGGKLDESLVRIYTRGILEGLDFLHSRGIVHCDVKGKNVLVGSSGVKLADFGAAKRLGNQRELQRQQQLPMIKGTPLWMAPEVVRQEEQGTESDIWSLGCTVLEMATGRAPWGDVKHTFSALYRIACSDELPDLPGWLSDHAKDFVMNCLRRDPRERWTSSQLLRHPFVNTTSLAMDSPHPPPTASPSPSPSPSTSSSSSSPSSSSSLTDRDCARISKLLAEMPVVAEEAVAAAAGEIPRRMVRPKLEVCGNWDQGQGNDPVSPGGKWIVVRSPQGRIDPDPFNLLSDFESGEDGEVIDPRDREQSESETEVGTEVEEHVEEFENAGHGGEGKSAGLSESCSEVGCSFSVPSCCCCGLVFCYEFGRRTDRVPQPKFKLGGLLQQEDGIGFSFSSGWESDLPELESWQCGRGSAPHRRKKMKRKKRSKAGGARRWIMIRSDDVLGWFLFLLRAPDSCVECKSRKVALFLLLFDSLSRRRKRRRKNNVKGLSTVKTVLVSLSLSSPVFQPPCKPLGFPS